MSTGGRGQYLIRGSKALRRLDDPVRTEEARFSGGRKKGRGGSNCKVTVIEVRPKKKSGGFFSFRFLKILNNNEKLGGGNHKKLVGQR